MLAAYALLFAAQKNPTPQASILGIANIRTRGGRTTMEILPIAAYRAGNYIALAGVDNPKWATIHPGMTFQLYRSGNAVGRIGITNVTPYQGDLTSFIYGTGTWKVDHAFDPTTDVRKLLPEEGYFAQSSWHEDELQGDDPIRALLACSGPRRHGAPRPKVSAKKLKEVKNAMMPFVLKLAKKRDMQFRYIQGAPVQAFDLDGDGNPEYVGAFNTPNGEYYSDYIFVIGQMRGKKFETQFVEPDKDYDVGAFDAIDIDGDGVEELVCRGTSFAGGGFVIVSKQRGKFTEVAANALYGE